MWRDWEEWSRQWSAHAKALGQETCIFREWPEGWRLGVNEKVRRGDQRGKGPAYRLGFDSEWEGVWGILSPEEIIVYLLFERPPGH